MWQVGRWWGECISYEVLLLHREVYSSVAATLPAAATVVATIDSRRVYIVLSSAQ